ncbi:MAG: TetR/AcrR family transcriptional regulator [Planctomycetota bacterium]
MSDGPSQEILACLTEVFRVEGYEGASLSRLAEAAGLKRASLYHHFPGGKQDMAEAVLRHVLQRFGGEVLATLAGDAEPRARLVRLSDALRRFYDDGRAPCLLGSFSLGAGLGTFQSSLADAFRAWIDAVAETVRAAGIPAKEARRRAEDAVIRVQGALVLTRGLDDPRLFVRTVRALPDELLA